MQTTRKITILTISILLLAVLFANYGSLRQALAQSTNILYLPQISKGVDNGQVAPVDEAAQRLSVPAGFSIRIFAQGLNHPRLMATGPDGWVYVANQGAGQIVRLPDRNGDKIADGLEVVASGLDSPHNLEWYNNQLYVSQIWSIVRLSDQNNNGVYETPNLVTDNLPGNVGSHYTRTLHFGPDGKMYVSVGSTCNYCVESDPRSAAILRFNPDGSIPTDNPFANDADTRKRPLWAWGLRNSVDFLWTPNGALWANHMGSDGLGDNTPPEEIIVPVQGNHSHGWPYCYTGVLGINSPTQPEVRDNRIALPAGFTCDQAVPALYTDLAHSAPIGMVSGEDSAFPAEYQDDIFVAYHGSWNTDVVSSYRDCKVQRIIVENGTVVGSQTFANGWRANGAKCGAATTWGRPAGVVFGADGSLYISDDKNGRVFRVTYTGN
jgi:glucose/arabinose dehydrogenase